MRGLVDDDGTYGDGIVPLSELVNPKHVVRESIVVPPSVRTLLVACRQNVHSILADSEEFSKAGAGIDELGLTLASGAGHSTTTPQPFTSLVAQCGGRHPWLSLVWTGKIQGAICIFSVLFARERCRSWWARWWLSGGGAALPA
jgi:hypothetical protein